MKLTLTDSIDQDTLNLEPFAFTIDTGKLFIAAHRNEYPGRSIPEPDVIGVVLDRDQVVELAGYLTIWLEEAPR